MPHSPESGVNSSGCSSQTFLNWFTLSLIKLKSYLGGFLAARFFSVSVSWWPLEVGGVTHNLLTPGYIFADIKLSRLPRLLDKSVSSLCYNLGLSGKYPPCVLLEGVEDKRVTFLVEISKQFSSRSLFLFSKAKITYPCWFKYESLLSFADTVSNPLGDHHRSFKKSSSVDAEEGTYA